MKGKIKAGILQLTLGVSFIIAALCGSVLMLAYYQRIASTEQKVNDVLRANCNSAIAWWMANRSSLKFNTPVKIDLYDEGTDSVEIIRRPWGLYELAVVRAWRGVKNDSKSALITSTPSEEGQASLYLSNTNAPVYLVGDTKIEGVVFISERKFSTGYIDGKGFNRAKLFGGEVKKSKAELPPLDTTLLFRLKQLASGSGAEAYSITQVETLAKGAYSFAPGCSYYLSEQAIELRDTIRGGIVIRSLIKIHVNELAVIEDAILIAPFIDIDQNVDGSMQCFASRQITVGKNSKLRYPSALALLGDDRDSSILVQNGASVQGLILIPGQQGFADKGKLKVEKDAFVQGMSYINGIAEIQGTSRGNLMARSVQVSTGEISYSNHLMDAVISPNGFKEITPGSLLWASGKGLRIAKWIP